MIVDARGKVCPEPVVMAIRALDEKSANEPLEVRVDNEAAVHNVTRMAEQKGFNVTTKENGDKDFSVLIGGDVVDEQKSPTGEKNRVVVFTSNTMGYGDDKLGEVLMKGFIYTLTQQPKMPNAMVFYNSGVKLTTKDSDSLEDLRWLEAQGVEILACGTCLNFYELTDDLSVGHISNMYSIVETLLAADQVIYP